MMTENSMSIQLGREELVSLLNLLGFKGMLGLGKDYLADFSEDAQRQILRAGANALRAKGWLREEVEDGQIRLRVDSTILALLGVCLSADRLLYISHWRVDAPLRTWYVHLGPSMTVIHRTTMPGVHEMWATVVPAEALVEIAALLQLDEATLPEGLKLTLSDVALAEVVELAGADGRETAVTNLLAKAGVTGMAGEVWGTAVRNVQASSMVSLLETHNSAEGLVSAPVRSVSFLRSAQDLWLVETAVGDASQLSLEQISIDRGKMELGLLLGLQVSESP